MRSDQLCLGASWLLFGVVAAPVLAHVFSSEFFSDPVSEGWGLLNQYCEPETWIEQGWYHQQLDREACPLSSQGGHDSYLRGLTDFDGEPEFFLEFRVQTDGDRSEIPAGAPTAVAMGNFAGTNYRVTVSRDLVKFLRDVGLPIWFIEIEPHVPHTYRIELYPAWYVFYIDGDVIDQGVSQGPFPAHEPRISWRGKSWQLPCENAWDYIRFGVIPADGSGDYDSDAAVDLDDFYFFRECASNSGPDADAGPGCRFADFDADTDVDLLDVAAFQNSFTGGE